MKECTVEEMERSLQGRKEDHISRAMLNLNQSIEELSVIDEMNGIAPVKAVLESQYDKLRALFKEEES